MELGLLIVILVDTVLAIAGIVVVVIQVGAMQESQRKTAEALRVVHETAARTERVTQEILVRLSGSVQH